MTRITHYLETHRGPQEVVYYVLYLLIAALALFVGLVIWRQTLLLLTYGLVEDNYVARLIYIVSMLFLSIGMLVGILFSDPYLRGGMRRGMLWRRFMTVVLTLVGIGALGMALQVALPL